MGGAVATINVSTPGEHTLNVWMREDGTMLDKVVLTTSNSYTPSGAGPPPSPRTGATGTTTLLEDNFNDSGLSPEGARIGTYALSSLTLPDNVDIQLFVRSQDPALDAVSSNNTFNWKFGTIGILFGYQDTNNYYRFEMNAMKGHRKLWHRQAGVFTELNTSPHSYVGGQ